MSTHRFQYTAWFRDLDASPDDEDHEWPACLLIEAADPPEAAFWGDHLARGFARRRASERFLHSTIEPDDGSWNADSVPVIRVGDEPTDEEIGW